MNIRGADFYCISQHSINKTHDRRFIFIIAIANIFLLFNSIHVQIIEMYIVDRAKHLADIIEAAVVQPFL